MEPRYYFSICQFGAEKAVKEEVLSRHPSLRAAYSRPGFATFKESDPGAPGIQNPESLFTRLWGQGLGQASNPAEIEALFQKIPRGAVVQAFDRETCLPGDEPESFVRGSRVAGLLRGTSRESGWNVETPVPGAEVYDLIWVDEDRLFLGKHWFQEGMDPAPGNDPRIELPADSPSRAYLKIEEAIHRFRPPMHPELEVLEVGCSPGGATTAMLNRGFLVAGIDPKRMHPAVETHPGFRGIRKTAGRVTASDLEGVEPEWLVIDMNLAPLEALDELQRVIRVLRERPGGPRRLRRGFLTLKLNDWSFVQEIPLYLRRISEIGFMNLTAVQLCSNRQEFFVHADGFR